MGTDPDGNQRAKFLYLSVISALAPGCRAVYKNDFIPKYLSCNVSTNLSISASVPGQGLTTSVKYRTSVGIISLSRLILYFRLILTFCRIGLYSSHIGRNTDKAPCLANCGRTNRPVIEPVL